MTQENLGIRGISVSIHAMDRDLRPITAAVPDGNLPIDPIRAGIRLQQNRASGRKFGDEFGKSIERSGVRPGGAVLRSCRYRCNMQCSRLSTLCQALAATDRKKRQSEKPVPPLRAMRRRRSER